MVKCVDHQVFRGLSLSGTDLLWLPIYWKMQCFTPDGCHVEFSALSWCPGSRYAQASSIFACGKQFPCAQSFSEPRCLRAGSYGRDFCLSWRWHVFWPWSGIKGQRCWIWSKKNSSTAWQEYTLLLLIGKIVAADQNYLSNSSYTHRNNWIFTSRQMDEK